MINNNARIIKHLFILKNFRASTVSYVRWDVLNALMSTILLSSVNSVQMATKWSILIAKEIICLFALNHKPSSIKTSFILALTAPLIAPHASSK